MPSNSMGEQEKLLMKAYLSEKESIFSIYYIPFYKIKMYNIILYIDIIHQNFIFVKKIKGYIYYSLIPFGLLLFQSSILFSHREDKSEYVVANLILLALANFIGHKIIDFFLKKFKKFSAIRFILFNIFAYSLYYSRNFFIFKNIYIFLQIFC